MAPHPSDSRVQREIEEEILSDLEKLNPYWQNVDLSKLPAGRELARKVKPDAVWRDEKGIIVIAECYVCVGKLKPGHRRKIATDILKLISLKDEFGKDDSTRLLLVVPEELGNQLEDNDWLSVIISKKIELVKVHLNDEQHQRLIVAVKHQGEGQAHTAKPDNNPNLQENLSMSLENEFHHAMIGVADYANLHQFGIRFRQMIDEFGAKETAKRLLAAREIQTGLMRLWELHCLNKSMEALVIQERFRSLFTKAEYDEAHRRLEELGYFSK